MRALRVLLVEDSELDASIVSRYLTRGGYELTVTRVTTRDALSAALEAGPWDAAIVDYELPGWTGLEALQVVRARDPDLAVVLVSGQITEETAVAAMRRGADDYVLKGNLARLAPALEREVREAEIRRAKRAAEQAAQRAQERLLDVERTARAEAEESERAAMTLALASRLLAESLDFEQTVSAIAEVTLLPGFVEACVLDEVQEDGTERHLATVHRPHARPEAQRVPAEEIRAAAATRTARIFDREALTRMAVPLVARGVPFAALTFTFSDGLPTRRELRLVEDIAGCCGRALDNARLYAAAQQAVKIRDEFLGIASHELKTPLTTLQLQVELLQRGAPQIATDTERLRGFQERLRTILRQTERLNRLVGELLEVSRLSQGRPRVELDTVDLVEVVRSVVSALEDQDLPARAGSEIVAELPPTLIGRWDRFRVEQIVTNLLSNALKYGGGGKIEVRVEPLPGRAARFTVRDHGIGIAPADQERIFGQFERAVSSRNYGGLGLGLYIVRQLTEAMGGTIAVSSNLGEGATFTVTLPLDGLRAEGRRGNGWSREEGVARHGHH